MSVPTRIILRGMFGKPTLQWLKNNGTESNGRAEWSREWRRYGQWTAKLSPGVQTDDDYGSVSWDVNGMRLADLEQISYVYRMGATEVVAPNVAIHVYDPNDIDNRADITLSHSTVGLGVSSGWQKYDLTTAIDGCFYYGNNIPSTTGLTSSDGTSATLYTLAQFQADPVFSTYVIGKITIEYGYYSTGYLTPAHICKVEVIHDGKRVDLELVPSVEEQIALLIDGDAIRALPAWTFGQPTVFAHNNGRANWDRGSWDVSTHQKGHTMWNAKLYGGLQTGGTSVAGVSIPVNEIPIPEFDTAKWTYFMDTVEAHGVNIVFWCHHPDDFDLRVEITQSGSSAGLEKANAQNAFEFPYTGGQGDMFYVGEITGTPDTTPTQYGIYKWTQFQVDSVFSEYTIFRITLEFGMYSTGTFTNAYLEDLELNGAAIQLGPKDGKHKKTVLDTQILLATEKVAGDVVSHSATGDAGVPWVFSFGGTGYITKAIISHDAAITPRLTLYLFDVALVFGLIEMDDSAAFNSPNATNLPYYVGKIEFPALSYSGSGDAISQCTVSTVGGLPIPYDSPTLNGVLVTEDTATFAATACNIYLTADMEDN